jgi:sulfite reductase alpha subunit-like flavoprotein
MSEFDNLLRLCETGIEENVTLALEIAEGLSYIELLEYHYDWHVLKSRSNISFFDYLTKKEEREKLLAELVLIRTIKIHNLLL